MTPPPTDLLPGVTFLRADTGGRVTSMVSCSVHPEFLISQKPLSIQWYYPPSLILHRTDISPFTLDKTGTSFLLHATAN